MLIRLREDYEVAEGPVTIDVVVGEGQRGHTSVTHEGRELGHGPTIVGLVVGPGPDLRGTELRVSTTVVDVNPSTNRTSVTYTLKGGKKEDVFRLEFEVQESGTVRYFVAFTLL